MELLKKIVYSLNLSLFGDPVEINVRGYELSIRKEEAAVVEVQ